MTRNDRGGGGGSGDGGGGGGGGGGDGDGGDGGGGGGVSKIFGKVFRLFNFSSQFALCTVSSNMSASFGICYGDPTDGSHCVA